MTEPSPKMKSEAPRGKSEAATIAKAESANLNTSDTSDSTTTSGTALRQTADWKLPVIVIVLGLVSGLVMTMQFPPVIGLGTLVRLPAFHGALTWANFIIFGVMGMVAFYAFFAHKARLYSWVKALRFSAIGLWIFNFALGLFASSLTWNFEAGSQPAIFYFLQEPRVQMQFLVSMMGLVILVLPLIFIKWRTLSLFDGIYGFLTLVLAYIAANAGSSLHPPSPVMNAEESIIRFTFLTMALSLIIMSSGVVMLVRSCILAKMK